MKSSRVGTDGGQEGMHPKFSNHIGGLRCAMDGRGHSAPALEARAADGKIEVPSKRFL